MPRGSKTKGRTFESWAETIGGGILFQRCAGSRTGPLDNTDKMKAFSDLEADAWTALVAEWWDKYQDQEVGSGDLSGFAAKHMTGQVGEGRSSATSWGIAFTSKRVRCDCGQEDRPGLGNTRGASLVAVDAAGEEVNLWVDQRS